MARLVTPTESTRKQKPRGGGQPNSLDKLDSATRDKCINLMLSGQKGCDSEVARIAGVSRQAINEYRRRHLNKALHIAARLVDAETKSEAASSIVRDVAASLPILAVREQRLAALQDRHNRMNLVMFERAEDMAAVPGGKSGLLVRQIKQIGSGANAREVEEYELDTGLLGEFREHEKQVAMELGQWQESVARPADSVSLHLHLGIPRLDPARGPQQIAAHDVTFEALPEAKPDEPADNG